ncbi:MAG: hypothetical protein Q9184_001951 [Pyrenodesmia sp. 2 TL-2023]
MDDGAMRIYEDGRQGTGGYDCGAEAVADALLDVNAQVLNSGGAIDDVKNLVTVPHTIRRQGASTTRPFNNPFA